MANYEQNYRTLLELIINQGILRNTRTGQVRAMFGLSLMAYVDEGFPILRGRKMFFNTIKAEAEWMLSGSTNVKDLWKHGVHIWDKWADADGELGPTYGHQLRMQWGEVIQGIMSNPSGRRHLINLWDVYSINDMALPPCYYAIQFVVIGNQLNIVVSSRSSDAAVGLPYDIAVLAYLLEKACVETDLNAGWIQFNMADVHINIENLPAVIEYLSRKVEPFNSPLSEIHTYTSEPHIKMIVKS